MADGAIQCGCRGSHMLDRYFPRAKVEKVRKVQNNGGGVIHPYPEWVKSICLQIYEQGFSASKVQELTGVNSAAIGSWARKAGINRSLSEAHAARRKMHGR